VSNADTLRRVFALMDERDYPSIRELLALEFSAVMGGNPPMGFEEWEGMGRMIYAGCPDGKHAFDETFEIGDRVASRGSFSGTHTGDLMGIPPTGKKVTITFMNIDRFADGKLAEHRSEADMLGLMQQLGAIPSS
jgi:predicted ester cyclase